MKRLVFVVLLALVALVPSAALAQEEDDGEDGFVLRANSPLLVSQDERIDTAVVLSDDARIAGVVEDSLVIVDGDAVVTGTVGDVVVINGSLDLRGSSHVTGDVRLIDSDLTRASGAEIDGHVRRGWGFRAWMWAFPVLVWVGATVAVLLSGLLFAAVGGRQLTGASELLTQQPGRSILAAVIAWVAVPVVAVLLMITLIGIPFGIGLLLFLLPALLFFGYLVAGTRLGSLIVRGRFAGGDRPYLPAVVGLGLLQLVVLIPALGGVVAFLAALWGSGGLALKAWRSWRRTEAAPPTPAPAPGTV